MMRKAFYTFLALAAVFCLIDVTNADSRELSVNGSFDIQADDNSKLPADWYYEAWLTDDETVIAMQENDGGFCVYIKNEIENDARFCQEIAVEPDSYYMLSCDVKAKGAEGEAGANISVLTSIASSEPVYNQAAWQRIELTGKTGSNQKSMVVAVRLGGYSALTLGEAWFDNFSIVKLDNEPQSAVADFSEYDTTGTGRTFAAGEVPYIQEIVIAVLLSALGFYIVYIRGIKFKSIGIPESQIKAMQLTAMLLGAFLLRCILSLVFYGHSTDITCFMYWANSMAEAGPANFYTSGTFADYPPGYMYILWLMGGIAKLLKLSYGSAGYVLLIKMPSILADLLAGYIIYKLAAKRYSHQKSLLLMGLVLFNPVVAFISGGWGQIDQVLTLFLILTIFLFINDKPVLAGLVYGIAILVKPQALMVGPLLAVAYIANINGKKWTIKLIKTVAAVIAALAAIVLLSLPFKSTQPWYWLFDKYFSTATSYPYASVEAFNLIALLGGNWKPVTDKLFVFSYSVWGTIGIILSFAYTAFLYLKSRKHEKHSLTLCMAYLLISIFTLGHFMHERYLFPALILILIAFIYYDDKRLYIAFSGFSVSMLLNALAAFVIVGKPEFRGLQYDILTIAGSAIEVVSFIYFTYLCTKLVTTTTTFPAFRENRKADEYDYKHEAIPVKALSPVDTKLGYTKRDKMYVLILTAIYAVIALFNLGSLKAPETAWKSSASNSEMTVEFTNGEVEISEIWVFGGLYEGTLELTSDSGFEILYDQINGDMYRWKNIGGGFSASGVTLKAKSGKLWINEIAFFDNDKKYVPAAVVAGSSGIIPEDAGDILDEFDTVPEKPTYLNGMYFDELYHARTGYEHLKGLTPYENSHPPLGKVFIMLGIAIFGMNAFGWRIIGTLFGIAMVPIMYAFGKRLFKTSEYALLMSTLFAFDFMHFTQTRISTIDVYGVFFIILMFYYMYKYYELNFYSDGLRKTLKPLFLAGLFFGLGAASKWICIYAGGGLAVILFTSLAQRFIEYRRAKKSEDQQEQEVTKNFYKNTLITLALCCLFYIAIPVGVYLLSYLPYVFSESKYTLEGIWELQEFMFNYHSGLNATHPFQSAWWEWPFILRPIWYYWGSHNAPGMASTIAAFGNPAVWWTCTTATIGMISLIISNRIKREKGMFVALVGVGANYLPWVLVTRCTFIYHFFASVPFIIICGIYMLKRAEERNADIKWLKWTWLGITVGLFILFLPALSGIEVPRWWVQILQWLPRWYFLGAE